jgi:hypothetical protein
LTGINTDSDSKDDSDSDSELEGALDCKSPVEALALKHPELLHTVGRKHWEVEFTKDMANTIAKVLEESAKN